MVNIVHGEKLNKKDAKLLIRKSIPDVKAKSVDTFLKECMNRVDNRLLATPSKLRQYNCPE